MAITDTNQILLAHDRWATRQMLDACAKLTSDQFHRTFEMGPGSLHNTLLHILGAMNTWTHTLAGDPTATRLDQDGKQRTVGELIELWESITTAFAEHAIRRPFDETVSRVREGKTYQFPRGVVVTQVLTHGMHHRAQCLNMLRQLGVKPLPPSSVVEWSRTMTGQ